MNSLSGFDRVKFEDIIQLAEHSAGQGAQCNCLFVLFSGLPVTQTKPDQVVPRRGQEVPSWQEARGKQSPANAQLIPLNYGCNSEGAEQSQAAHLPSKDNKEKETT